MTSQYAYPSEIFPAYPRVTFEVPDGWEPLVVPGTLLAAGRATEPGTFRPNVIVAISRYAAGYQLQTAVDAVAEKFAGLEQAREIGRDEREIEGRVWAHVESSFIDSRAGTLVQAAHLTIVENGPVVDLIQVTGTVTGTQAHAGLLDEVRAVQRSVVALPS